MENFFVLFIVRKSITERKTDNKAEIILTCHFVMLNSARNEKKGFIDFFSSLHAFGDAGGLQQLRSSGG